MDLHDAADKGNAERVKTLVEQGVDKDKCDSEGWTPLWLASFNNHLGVVQYLVEQGASLDKDSNATHSTPLCTAVHHGHLEIVRYLLQKGADKDKRSNNGYTPLIYAMRRGHLEIAKLLMSYGADLYVTHPEGELPFGRTKTVEMLQAVRDEPRRRLAPGGCANMNLHDAARYGNLERVKFLHEQGVEHDNADSEGRTPLWRASSNGHLDVVQYLVEHGASLETTANGTGVTPLLNATRFGHLEMVRHLLEQGADRDKGDIENYSPLHWATMLDLLEIAMLLMSYGADLNARNGQDELPIDFARNEDMRQAILDEPRRRMDHGYKRTSRQDTHSDADTLASVQQENEEEEGEEPSNKRPKWAVAAVDEAEETKVASEDEESEPSSDEAGDD